MAKKNNSKKIMTSRRICKKDDPKSYPGSLEDIPQQTEIYGILTVHQGIPAIPKDLTYLQNVKSTVSFVQSYQFSWYDAPDCTFLSGYETQALPEIDLEQIRL